MKYLIFPSNFQINEVPTLEILTRMVCDNLKEYLNLQANLAVSGKRKHHFPGCDFIQHGGTSFTFCGTKNRCLISLWKGNGTLGLSFAVRNEKGEKVISRSDLLENNQRISDICITTFDFLENFSEDLVESV